MSKIADICDMIKEHLSSESDTAYTDRQMLRKIRDELDAYLVDDAVKVGQAYADNRKISVYDRTMAEMTLDEFADLNVRLVLINGETLCWCTSYGQLFPFGEREDAVDDMREFLSAEY